MRDFIDRLTGGMTTEEKIGQLNLITPGDFTNTGAVINKNAEETIRRGNAGGIFGIYGPDNILPYQKAAVKESRLKIPLLCGLDVIHGHKTIFPLPLALSCTWNMEMIEETARIAAVEAVADGLSWVFSPMVDIARDPRWGRIAESAGEDPYLGGEIAKAMIHGYQGGDLARPETVLACVKHLAAYGAAEAGRDYNTVDMGRLRLFETYLPPYQAAIEAGCGSAMTAFNDLDGIPASANHWLLTGVLREKWGFDGLVVSDYTAINEMTAHGLGDLQNCSARALAAGCDMDMVGEGFLTTLQNSLKNGSITMEMIDAACRRILEAKYKLGLFDDPYRYLDADAPSHKILTGSHRKAARKAVAESCVLLKNAENILPLQKSGTLALIGPLADDRRNLPGTWSIAADWQECVSVHDGIKKLAGDSVDILHAKGANIVDDPHLAERLNVFGETVVIDPRPPQEMIDEALATAKQADIVIAVLGEAKEMSGEAASRADIGLPECQKKLLRALKRCGKPLVLVLMSGRPLTLAEEHETADAILMTWFGGTESGSGIADILFGAEIPSGKLTASFPVHVGQIPVYYAQRRTGRPPTGDPLEKFRSRYLDIPNDSLYPFGYGLSYTEFSYAPPVADQTELNGRDAVLTLRVAVTNTGDCDGYETVQLYITDPVCSITRPVKELKAFQKLLVKKDETRDAVFTLTADDLKYLNADGDAVFEGGEFILHTGSNSRDTQRISITWR